MAARLIYALTVLVCLVLTASANEESYTQKVVQESNKIAIELYKQTHALEPNKNQATAGTFVWILLNLLSLGNTGASRIELKQALGLEKDKKDFQSGEVVPTVLENIEEIKGIDLGLASRIYIKDDGSFTTDDFDVDAYRYGVEVVPLTLNKPEAAARIINTWFQKKTNDWVKEIVSAKDLGPDSSLILLNSIFIEAIWHRAFDIRQTRRRPFRLLNGTTVEPEVMATTDNFRYNYNKLYDAKVLAIPLKGKEASVVFVLPSKKDGLANLVKKLEVNGNDIFTSALKLDEERVKVRIPKTFLETSNNLKTVLPKLGISSIFQRGKSGLSYILDSGEEVVVTTATQKTIFIVDEEGENEYQYYQDIRETFLLISPPEFYADHPYLAAVVAHNGHILYISQITNPSL